MKLADYYDSILNLPFRSFFCAEFQLINWDENKSSVAGEIKQPDWVDELCDMAMMDLAEEEVEPR